LLVSNLKSIYLQDITIVRQESFRFLEIKYFYLNLLKDTHALKDYIIFGKNIFYCDIYMFTQQVRRVTITKDINKQLYLCLRKFVII